MGTPVVVVEHRVGVAVLHQQLGQLQLVVGDVVNELVHLVGVGVEGQQGLIDAHQVVHLLKNAGENGAGAELLPAVHRLGGGLVVLPGGLGDVQIGMLHGVFPVLDVLDDPVLVVMDGELAGQALGPVDGDAPAVFDGAAAGTGHGVLSHDGVAKEHGEEFVLVHKSVGIAAVDGLKEVVSLGQHTIILLFTFLGGDARYLYGPPVRSARGRP